MSRDCPLRARYLYYIERIMRNTVADETKSISAISSTVIHTSLSGMDAPHDRCFSLLIQIALFKVEQHLEFAYFHTLLSF